MTEHLYHWRSRDVAMLRHLRAMQGTNGQVSIPIPGYRPDRGRCPACRAPEDRYCFLGCPLIDPHALRHVDALPRCLRCRHLAAGDPWAPSPPPWAADDGLGIMPGSRIVHLARADATAVALCSRGIQPLVPLKRRHVVRRQVVVVTCDRDGCDAKFTAPANSTVRAALRKAGWDVGNPRVDYCPEHPRPRVIIDLGPEEKGFPLPPRIWTCVVCGAQEPWGPTWRWYGSYRQMEDGKELDVVCSAVCRRQHVKAMVNAEVDRRVADAET